jgi:uncharacterized GH25 family protein
MKRTNVPLALSAIVAATIAAGCGGGEQPAGGTASPPAAGQSQEVKIMFTSDPIPPKAGENMFDVQVVGRDGRPVADADVAVEFYMAPIPSKMPEMRNRFPLAHDGGGRYRGSGNITMSGIWDVTVTAKRGGQEIGRHTLSVTVQ